LPSFFFSFLPLRSPSSGATSHTLVRLRVSRWIAHDLATTARVIVEDKKEKKSGWYETVFRATLVFGNRDRSRSSPVIRAPSSFRSRKNGLLELCRDRLLLSPSK
jgi:hypothetical protein